MVRSDEERERRLAEALRANLHRRKAQARRRDPASVHDGAVQETDSAQDATGRKKNGPE